MIDWNEFKNNLKKYFENYTARDEGDAAKYIADQYELAVLNGEDILWKNSIVTYQKKLLEKTIETAFKLAKKTNNNNMFSNFFSNGIIMYWTGAQLNLIKFPLGTTGIISNNVINPGTPQVLLVKSTNSVNEFIDNLINFFKLHLLTVGGITIAIVPGTPPVPTPFPWQGYS